jgi:DNA-directed RNA polymerase specialized sigma24 family protein
MSTVSHDLNPYETLPKLEELQYMDELTAYELYRAEIRRLPHLSRRETAPLVERARQGDRATREHILLTCQTYAFLKAVRIYQARQPEHLEVLDLVGAANLALIENLDKGLRKDDPVAYLMGVAIKTIQRECTYHDPLIQIPFWSTPKSLDWSHWPCTESLDEPLYRENGERLRVDQLANPHLPHWEEEQLSHRFAPLHDAVNQLPPAQRATIIRTYGLFGQPMETAGEISQTEGTLTRSVSRNVGRARNNLRQMLEEHLPGMVSSLS